MIPKSFKPYLWSYDLEKLDLQNDKMIIISNVLNLGGQRAVKDMFEIYKREEVKSVFETLKSNNLNKKSYNFWKIILYN